MDLRAERRQVAGLLDRARQLADSGEDSKFEKLREVLRNQDFAREKLILFTEHRDTAEFLVRRLEGLGFTGQVAFIHGGLDYREREAQVELFRRPLAEGGAQYLGATDAAGEGVNLQFCWLMVNYDVPWNPARLEQRMGRIHRYGQKRDPVIIVNLTATDTREGRVLKVLLDKLEAIRRQLRSDKVFDVVGRLFQNVSLKSYLEMATTDDGERAAINGIEGLLTEAQLRALGERERAVRRRRGQKPIAGAQRCAGAGAIPQAPARLCTALCRNRGVPDRSESGGRSRWHFRSRSAAPARARSGADRHRVLSRRNARPVQHHSSTRSGRGELDAPGGAGLRPFLRSAAVAARRRN
ncbi:MAG: helicase-related protein [Stellaceae bacterium]